MNKTMVASELVRIAKGLMAGDIVEEFKRGGVTVKHVGSSSKNLENKAEGFGTAHTDQFDVTLSSGEKHVLRYTTHGQGGSIKLDNKPGAFVVDSKGKAYRWQMKNLDKPTSEWVQENFEEPQELAIAVNLIEQYYNQFR